MDVDNPAYPIFSVHDDSRVVESWPVKPNLPIRGVGWVLRWAASLAMIFVSLIRLADFGFQLAAENVLVRAARAGALEATLPRATCQSVAKTVERRLQGLVAQPHDWKIFVEQNGTPVHAGLSPREGDRFSVAVTLSGRATLPSWLRALNFWAADRPIEARAERRMPGRELPARGTP